MQVTAPGGTASPHALHLMVSRSCIVASTTTPLPAGGV
jgi:hypothetical protein